MKKLNQKTGKLEIKKFFPNETKQVERSAKPSTITTTTTDSRASTNSEMSLSSQSSASNNSTLGGLRMTAPPSTATSNGNGNGSAGVVEQCLITAKATVMLYDDAQKIWIHYGSGPPGQSKCQIYHHLLTQTYRVVARKVPDQEILINSVLQKGTRIRQFLFTSSNLLVF